jgi:hypothetical protein
LQKVYYRANLLQIEEELKREKIILKEEAQAAWIIMIISLTAKLKVFPFKLIPKLAALETEDQQLEEANKLVMDALRDLSSDIDEEDLKELETCMELVAKGKN